MRSKLILAAILAFGLGGQTCSADPITYNFVDYSALESGYTLSGTITTDGTIGELSDGNILSFSLTFTEGSTTYSDSGTSNGVYIDDSDNASVVASATAITLAIPSSGNYAQLDLSGVGGNELNYERANASYGNTSDTYYSSIPVGRYGTTLWEAYSSNSNGVTLGSNELWTIAVAPAAVPEPSSLVMCGLGGVGVALAAWRRRRAATA